MNHDAEKPGYAAYKGDSNAHSIGDVGMINQEVRLCVRHASSPQLDQVDLKYVV